MKRERFIKFIILIALVLACYYPSVHGDFIWDDLDYIADNKALHSLAGLKAIWLNPQATTNYYPLFFTGIWLQYQLWGENVLGYHVINIVFHIFNALLIWHLLDRLKIAGGFAAALLFAIHPVNVESVAWISELKNTQSTFFMLLSVLFFHSTLKMDSVLPYTKPILNKRTAFFLFSIGTFLCALTTKPVTVILCGIFLIVFWLENIKFKWGHLLMLVPFILLGTLSIALCIRSEQSYIMVADTPISISFWERILIMGQVFWFYPLKIIWPEPLMFIYPKWEISFTSMLQCLYLSSVLLIFVLLIVKRNSIHKGVMATFLYYCLTIAPVSGLLDFQNLSLTYVADHFQYLPSIGLLAFFVNVAIAAQKKWKFGLPLIKPALMILLVITLSVLSWKHAGNFKTRVSIYSDTIRKDPQNEFAYNLRGRAYVKEGRYDLALADFSRAVRIKPGYHQALSNRAVVYTKVGKRKKALCDFDRVLELNPNDQRVIKLRKILINKHRPVKY